MRSDRSRKSDVPGLLESVSGQSMKRTDAYDMQNYEAACVILADPERYVGCLLEWAGTWRDRHLEFVREQQEQCAKQLRAKHPERAGLQMAISDWIAEEAIFDAETRRRGEKRKAG
jgi:hypothetical protein